MKWMLIGGGLALLGGLACAVALRPAAGGPLLHGESIPGQPVAMAVDTRARRVFVLAFMPGSRAGHVLAFDTGTGAPLGGTTVASLFGAQGTLAIDPRTQKVFATGDGSNPSSATTAIVGARGGVVRKAVALGETPLATAVNERTGRVFLVSRRYVMTSSPSDAVAQGGEVSIFDTTTGSALEATNLAGPAVAVAVDRAANRLVVSSDSASGVGGAISLIDARTGQIAHTIAVSLHPSLVAADETTGRAFVLEQRNVATIDTRTGTLVRTVPLGYTPTTMVVSGHTGRVFVAGDARGAGASPFGRLSMLDATGGRLVHTATIVGHPRAMAIDTRRARVLVAGSGATDRQGQPWHDGTLIVLDARSGRVLVALSIAGAPDKLALDEQTGHVFVMTTAGQGRRGADSWVWLPRWLRGALPFLQPSSPATAGSLQMFDVAR